MKLTPRQYETLRWMDENNGVIILVTGFCGHQWNQAIHGKDDLVYRAHRSTLNSLHDKGMFRVTGRYSRKFRQYKIATLGVAALREYEEKGKK